MKKKLVHMLLMVVLGLFLSAQGWAQVKTITGNVTDETGQPLPGAAVVVLGTTNGTITDNSGNYSIKAQKGNQIRFTFIGLAEKVVTVDNGTVFNVGMTADDKELGEVVVVGYGTQKKVNLTSSVTQVDSKIIENRPVANAAQALQGAVSNLQVSTTSYGGEPGAEMNLNIRGFMTSGGTGSISASSPLILVDGIEMGMNDIDPEDIETVSVLKDASAASIYGSRAAGGAILITTKSGKNMKGGLKITYSNNFSMSTPTNWPNQASAIDFAYGMNDASLNAGGTAYYTEEELGWIKQNMENPGSAPTLVAKADGLSWDQASFGLGATASTNWKEFLYKDWSSRSKHNINISGGDDKLNYYISAGKYDEDGLLKVAENSYSRYNLDAKIAAKPYKWLSFELLTKVMQNKEKYPYDYQYGRGRMFDVLSKLKPTLPTVDPIYGEALAEANYPLWNTQTGAESNNQIILLPRVTVEPLKNWLINLEYNYKRNNNRTILTALQYAYHRPNGDVAYSITKEQTYVKPTLYTNDYNSPNLYTSYTKSLGGHNFKIMAGYQSELYNAYNINASALNLLTENVISISTAVGTQTVSDAISHWSTESLFSRFDYNYKEKYLLQVSYRRDGSSKFETGSQWAGFPSFSAGYNIAKEEFWPIKDIVSTFKFRGSYGTLGNQNVNNYLSVPTIPVSYGNYLFDGTQVWTANAPDLTSLDLTWETVQTTDFGIDASAFGDKLTMNFDWYRTDISNMAASGSALPTVLGTDAPLTNVGTSRIQGWEAEIMWKQSIKDFRYNVRFVLSDYQRSIVDYPNPTNLLSSYYAGQDLGEIRGLEWAGWFESAEDVTNYTINQSYVYSSWTAGDTKYVDQNDDKVINNGTNTLGDSGDFVVIGNTTPRYQFGLTLGCDWKGIDFSMFIQGVGKRDMLQESTLFRGLAQGPLHANAMVENMDYWRDETSALGANPDAYFAKPYSANPGQNNRNYRYNVDRYVQDASYIRLKSIQVGYTLPKLISRKVMLDKVRVFVSGENLLTFTKLLMYDPEVTPGNFSNAVSYPLSKVISTGLNISF